ncbi:MAG: hypothetical protein IIC20_03865, partial [Chloroflexi bacterium]|nr:hypothetical protein [Chloroflexota bacterium]
TAREELLVRLFVSLSHEAPAGQDKLSWLRRAETLSLSSRTAGQMGMLIGRALDEAGRLDEALAHYRGMLLAADSPMINHAGRRIVAWLHAARRAGALLSRVSEAQRTEWEDDLLSALVDGGVDEARVAAQGLLRLRRRRCHRHERIVPVKVTVELEHLALARAGRSRNAVSQGRVARAQDSAGDGDQVGQERDGELHSRVEPVQL